MPKPTAKTKAKPNASRLKPTASLPSTTAMIPHDSPQNNVTDLLTTGIKELYWTENHLVLVLPKIQASAGAGALKKAVGDHLKVTKGHVVRLEKIFGILGLPPQAKKADGLEGLAMEGEGMINSTSPGSRARDAGLIMACQKVETYEITSYKGLAFLAHQLGEQDIAELLEQTMAEEQEADDVLTDLASKAS